MSETYWHRENSTDYIKFLLKEDKAALNLTGKDHIVLVLKPSVGSAVEYSSVAGSPKLFITDAGAGKVELRPASTDFEQEKEPYTGYFKVYNDATLWFGVPGEDDITIRVRSSYA